MLVEYVAGMSSRRGAKQAKTNLDTFRFWMRAWALMPFTPSHDLRVEPSRTFPAYCEVEHLSYLIGQAHNCVPKMLLISGRVRSRLRRREARIVT